MASMATLFACYNAYIPIDKFLRRGKYLLNNCILMKENNCVISLRIKKDGTCSKLILDSLGQGNKGYQCLFDDVCERSILSQRRTIIRLT